MLTSFEIFPSGEKWLALNYFCGNKCKKYTREVKRALIMLSDQLDCTKVVYHTNLPGIVRTIGGKQISVLYEMER